MTEPSRILIQAAIEVLRPTVLDHCASHDPARAAERAAHLARARARRNTSGSTAGSAQDAAGGAG